MPIEKHSEQGSWRPQKRIGIHEALITCQQMNTCEERATEMFNTRGIEDARLYVKYVVNDNEHYFDWLFNDKYKNEQVIAEKIKLAPKARFHKSSHPYVKDLFDINSALQTIIHFCRRSKDEVIKESSKKFETLLERYINFTNRIFRRTNIPFSDLKKAITKLLQIPSWHSFRKQFSGVLKNRY